MGFILGSAGFLQVMQMKESFLEQSLGTMGRRDQEDMDGGGCVECKASIETM